MKQFPMPARRGVRAGLALVGATLTSAALIGCGGGDGVGNIGLRVDVLSSANPQFVSGGDALVSIGGNPPEGTRMRVQLNGADISSAFQAGTTVGGKPTAVVTGLRNGENVITAEVLNIVDSASYGTAALTLTNHPRNGPMFSGPRETPFICQTQSFLLPDGSNLGAPLDPNDCSIATRVDYVYRTTATTGTAFKPLASRTAPLPADVARTTTNEGRSVPYVVRIETGTANRAIYQTSVLHDPTTEATPTFNRAPAGWNGRLIYTFGGGCTGGWYRQGTNTGGVLEDKILSQGYAMASSSLNVFGNNCQDLTAAESMAMVKERFIETYGPPRYTMGFGCSGGSYQQHQIGDNYPGLLDGIIPGCSFPEVAFATVHSITDQRLLGHYFRDVVPGTFTADQQRRIAGVQNVETIYTGTVYNGALRIAPNTFCPAVLPVEQRYNATTNPRGVRCDVYDHTVNVFGRDPATGFARRPLDNVGIQYGLKALNEGVITVAQFLDLNAAVGGYDRDANFVAQRTVGDSEAMKQAYQTGRLTSGGGGLKDIPIIDYRAYNDELAGGDIHLRYHSFSMRERLAKANGDADNHVMLHEDNRYGLYSTASPLLMRAIAEMDRWLANIAADTSNDSKHRKVVRNKPATLVEGCMSKDASPTFIAETQRQDSGQCAALYPAPGSPRFVAGAPIASDVIKCQLKPVALGDYRVTLTAAEQTRLAAIFPAGVCNWTAAGIEQQGLRGTWLRF